MKGVPQFEDPNLLVGPETADDAGVYQIDRDKAIVQTVDVFTPVVDDPFTFGQIVAANCMSDVWAMGAEVLTVMNLLGYAPKKLDWKSVSDILKGVANKVREAGAVICGGHTWMDPEIRVGLSVTGIVHPEKIITNAGAKSGDALVLTKPLGSGILSYAAIQGKLEEENLKPVILAMTTLNLYASRAMQEVGVHAATDVTGFSILGHAVEMAEASQAGLEIHTSMIPVFNGALDMAAQNVVTPLCQQNEMAFRNRVAFEKSIPRNWMKVLYDPQTSGGLLICVPQEIKDRLMESLVEHNVEEARIIGRVTDKNPGKIKVFD